MSIKDLGKFLDECSDSTIYFLLGMIIGKCRQRGIDLSVLGEGWEKVEDR